MPKLILAVFSLSFSVEIGSGSCSSFSSSLADHSHFDHPPPSSSPIIPKVVPISMDIDRTVQRLEREVVTPGGGGQEEEEFSYHGDDILPMAAEGMGPGKYTLL